MSKQDKSNVKDVAEDVAIDTPVKSEVEVAAPVAAPNTSDTSDFVSKEDFESAVSKISDLIAGMKVPAPVATPTETAIKVSPQVTKDDAISASDVLREALKTTGIHTVEVDVEDYIARNMTYNEKTKVTEAFSAGGSAANGEFPAPAGSDFVSNSRLSIRPSGESFIPVRQWLDIQVLPVGTNEAIWYHIDSSFSGNGSLNAVISTDITEQSKVISNTRLTVTKQVGFRTVLNATDLEDSKFDLALAFREIAARRKLQSELTNVLSVLQSSNNLHGGIASGALIGTTTLDSQIQVNRTQSTTGTKELTIADVLNIVSYYKETGYDGWSQTAGNTPVLMCSINTWKTLLAEAISSQSYASFFVGSNLITGKPTFEQLFGITIVPCSAIATASGSTINLATSAYTFLPRYSIAMATKRELEIRFQEDSPQLSLNVTASWRDAFQMLDAHSVVRYDLTSVSGALAAKTS